MKTTTATVLRKLGTLLPVAVTLASLLTACNSDNNDSASNASPTVKATTTCLWRGPLTASNPDTNYAYPDAGAYYWSGIVTVPAGARVFIKGQYPHSRYISYVSYNSDGTPKESLADTAITPDAGSVNPFVAGNMRTLAQRDYGIEIVPGDAPSGARPANTLYAPVASNQTITVLYRVYVPDNGRDIMGDVALPALEVHLADGSVQTGNQACQTLNASPDLFPRTSPSQTTYLTARDQAGTPVGFPAANPGVWHAAYNTTFNFKCIFYGACTGTPVRTVGYYANPDNAYTFANISRDLGKVVVLRGKIPAVATTYLGDQYAQLGQLRYWSMCSNEYFTQKVTACLFDQQVPINADGSYTIVVSQTGDRPSNANLKCGVGYLEWSAVGDGLSHANDGLLIMRNMLPSPGFTQAIQNTATPGDETTVLGDYLPSISYMSQADFEARGCPSYP